MGLPPSARILANDLQYVNVEDSHMLTVHLTLPSLLRLAAMKRELKVKELNLIDSSRRRFLKHQQDQRRIQLKRLDDEIQRKVLVCCCCTSD